MNKKPIIYLAFGKNDTNSLPYLNNELRAIEKIITQQESFEILIHQHASIHQIVETLINYKERISIFHYAGHIHHGSGLFLQNESEGVGLEGLTKMISVLKNIRLVFLNGASSSSTVKDLLESGVKAVIATNRPVTDSSSTEFAIQFYRNFIEGKSLSNSFESAVSLIKLKETPSARYFEFKEEEKLAWGLYVNVEEDQILDWKISDEDLKLSINRIHPIIEKIKYIKSCIDFDSILHSQIEIIEKKWNTLENEPRDADDKSQRIFSLESKIIESELDVIIKYELKNNVIKRGIVLRERLVQQKVGKYYVLIIGINEYEHLSKLNGALKDAQAFKELLESEFYISKIFYLPNAKIDKILDTLDELEEKISEDDNIIIFYAGHGHWEEISKNGYWMPKDAETNKRKFWMPNSTINDYIRQFSKCKHVLVISDSCYSGALLDTRSNLDINNSKKDIKILYKSKSRQVLTSGAKELVPDESVFFKYLIKALQESEGNAISANTIFSKIRNKVITDSPSEQKPQIGRINHSGHDGGDFIFFKKEGKENTATNNG